MPIERRNSERKRILLEAKWESMSRRHEARVDDVSLGGCFVNTFGRVEPNESISLEVKLPNGKWLRLKGRVATYQPGVGFGISFTSLTAEARSTLRDLIESKKDSGSPT